jgi:hypothetical protein
MRPVTGGGPDRIRTDDSLLAKQVLCQAELRALTGRSLATLWGS